MKKILSVLLVAFLIVSAFVACSQESTLEILYHGDYAKVTFDLGAEGAEGSAPKYILSNKGTTIILPEEIDATFEGFDFVGWTDGEEVYDPGDAYKVKDSVTITALWGTEISFVKGSKAPNDYVAPTDTLFVIYGQQFGLLDEEDAEGKTLFEKLPTDSRELETYVWENSDEVVITEDTIVTKESIGNGELSPVSKPVYTIEFWAKKSEVGSAYEKLTDAPALFLVKDGTLQALYKATKEGEITTNVQYVINADAWTVNGETKATSETAWNAYEIDEAKHVVKLYGSYRKIIALDFNYVFGTQTSTEYNCTKYVDITETKAYSTATDLDGNLILSSPWLGHSVNKWTVTSSDGTERTSVAPGNILETDVMVTAKWNTTVDTYSVVFNANYDDATPATKTQSGITFGTTGEATIKLADNSFVRTGYKFVGWNTKADGSGSSFADKATADSTYKHASNKVVTLYAIWVQVPEGVDPTTYNPEEVAEGDTVSYAPGSGKHLSAVYVDGESDSIYDPTTTDQDWIDNGYWNPNCVEKDGNEYKWKHDHYVSYSYDSDDLEVIYDENEGTDIDNTSFTYGAPSVTIASATASTRDGYTFKEWNTKDDGTGTGYAGGASLTQTNGDIYLYAQWTPNVITVTFMEGSTQRAQKQYTFDAAATLPTLTSTSPTKTNAKLNGYYDGDKLVVKYDGTSSYSWNDAINTYVDSGNWKYDDADHALTLTAKYDVAVVLVPIVDANSTAITVKQSPVYVLEGSSIEDAFAAGITVESGYSITAYENISCTGSPVTTIPTGDNVSNVFTVYIKAVPTT